MIHEFYFRKTEDGFQGFILDHLNGQIVAKSDIRPEQDLKFVWYRTSGADSQCYTEILSEKRARGAEND